MGLVSDFNSMSSKDKLIIAAVAAGVLAIGIYAASENARIEAHRRTPLREVSDAEMTEVLVSMRERAQTDGEAAEQFRLMLRLNPEYKELLHKHDAATSRPAVADPEAR